jgi:hypothetical protein
LGFDLLPTRADFSMDAPWTHRKIIGEATLHRGG